MSRNQNQSNVRQSRLSRQIEQVISLALGGSGDPRLRDLVVHSVVAKGGGATIVVRLVLSSEVSFERIERAHQALGAARAFLRQEIAAEIRRKHVPDLEFQVLAGWEAVP